MTVVPEGKNHGLYFLMDWSGSMSDKIIPTLFQLFLLIDFCRKCNIAHEVYAFTDFVWTSEGPRAFGSRGESESPYAFEYESMALGDSALKMIQLFTHKMSKREYRYMKECLYLSLIRYDQDHMDAPYITSRMKTYERRKQDGHKPKKIKETLQHKIYVRWLKEQKHNGHWSWGRMGGHVNWPLSRLCGTPLNDALMVSTANVKRFQRNNKLDIVNTIILTDGESNSSCHYYGQDRNGYDSVRQMDFSSEHKNRLIDRDTQKTFKFNARGGTAQTADFLEYYKYKTGSNICGFFLATSSDKAARFAGRYRSPEYEQARSEYNRFGYTIVEQAGYDELYAIKSTSGIDEEDEMKVDHTKKVTTASLTSAFKRHRKNKLDKRIMLQRFAQLVA